MLGERKVVHVDVADLFIEFATYVGVYFFLTYVQAAPRNDVPPPENERTCSLLLMVLTNQVSSETPVVRSHL